MTGFMDGYTRWIIEDEDDDVEDADMAGNEDTGQDEEMIGNGGGEEAGVGERSNFKKIPTHTQDHGDA